ncbi:MAG: M20/M25/M40 family metallo-hydrolase, partial [Planctomycetes bacterium]|nr:M20/M25/M40 family metallo-hydrolase [Planctomycetota bacterium]
MVMEVSDKILKALDKSLASADCKKWTEDLLLELVEIDTSPKADVRAMKANEDKAYDVIKREVGQLLGESASVTFLPIDPRVEAHPAYTPPHYTKTEQNPAGLTAAQAYADRGNLLVKRLGANSGGTGYVLALNSHVDVVAPHFPGRLEGDVIFGRGACDAKGAVVAMLLQMRLLRDLEKALNIRCNKDVLYQFVTEEEPGGNGSLSVALDPSLTWDAMLVGEITKLKVHPANRGALWYKAELNDAGQAGVNLVEMAARVVLALEDEGAKIKGESAHPLFPTRPVQTNHGIIGPYGKHPSSVNDKVTLVVRIPGASEGQIEEVGRQLMPVVTAAVAKYCERYGDKTRENDPRTNKPKVAHHFEIRALEQAVAVNVLGKAGHMGAILECDNAITKAAYVVQELVSENRRSILPGDPRKMELGLSPSAPRERQLVLEGGQGFVPTHQINEIQWRLTGAVQTGVRQYCEPVGVPYSADMARVTFDKLHNDAFEQPIDSPAMRAAIYACKRAGIWVDEPIVGWTVSCDARLFAKQHPTRTVLTFGPGSLEHAHSAHEQVRVPDLLAAAKTLAIFAL